MCHLEDKKQLCLRQDDSHLLFLARTKPIVLPSEEIGLTCDFFKSKMFSKML